MIVTDLIGKLSKFLVAKNDRERVNFIALDFN